MSHEVESMAYTNEVPWHGLGQYVADAPNVDAMLKVASIDWTVSLRDLFISEQGMSSFEQVDSFKALTRDLDNSVLDVVGSRYTPIQNEDAFRFFCDFVEAGDATMETAGSLRGGRYVWGLARLNKSFKLPGKDEVKGYVLVACPHQQGKSMIIKFTSVRVVCNNTLTLALRHGGHEVRIHHRRAFGEDAIKNAKVTLGIAREKLDEFEDNARKLKVATLNLDDARYALASAYQPEWDGDEETLSPTMKRLMDIHEKAPGADPFTAWGVLNTVTYYVDHVASRSADKRLTNAWFGQAAKQKEKVLASLLD